MTSNGIVDREEPGRATLGIVGEGEEARIIFRFGDVELRWTAEEGEEFCVDLGRFVQELRHGGRFL